MIFIVFFLSVYPVLIPHLTCIDILRITINTSFHLQSVHDWTVNDICQQLKWNHNLKPCCDTAEHDIKLYNHINTSQSAIYCCKYSHLKVDASMYKAFVIVSRFNG